MQEEHEVSQEGCDNNGINNNNNEDEIEYVDYMEKFGEEKLLTEDEIEEDIFTFEEFYRPDPREEKHKLDRFYLPMVAKYVGTNDLIQLAKVNKKTSNINYSLLQNFDNVEHQKHIFRMNTHVIYTAESGAPCQFIKDAIHEIKGNPLSNKDYFNCEIYMLCEKDNPRNKFLFGYSRQIPKDLFNCAVYFIKDKGLESVTEVNAWYSRLMWDLIFLVDDPDEDNDDDVVIFSDVRRMRMWKRSIPFFYKELIKGMNYVIMNDNDFYDYFKTGKYEIQCFNAGDVIAKMIEVGPYDHFRIKYIKEFDDRVSINGVIIRKPSLINYGVKDFNYFKGLCFHEAGFTPYNRLFGFNPERSDINEKSSIDNPFYENNDLDEVYVINSYLAFSTNSFSFYKNGTNGKVRNSIVILVNKNLYSTILIKNKDDFIPVYYDKDRYGRYKAISMLKGSDIYLACTNLLKLDNLFWACNTNRNSFQIFGIAKYLMDENTIVQNVPYPIDLFYYKYRAVEKRNDGPGLFQNVGNPYACEDALIEVNHEQPLPIQEFTFTIVNEALSYPDKEIKIFEKVYVLDKGSGKYIGEGERVKPAAVNDNNGFPKPKSSGKPSFFGGGAKPKVEPSNSKPCLLDPESWKRPSNQTFGSSVPFNVPQIIQQGNNGLVPFGTNTHINNQQGIAPKEEKKEKKEDDD